MYESFSRFCLDPVSENNRKRMREFLAYCKHTSLSKYEKDEKAVTNNLYKVIEKRYLKKGIHSVTLVAALLKLIGGVIELVDQRKGEPIIIPDGDDDIDTQVGPAGIRIRVKPSSDGKFIVMMDAGSIHAKTDQPVDVEKAQETVKEFIRVFADALKWLPITEAEAEVIEGIKDSETLN